MQLVEIIRGKETSEAAVAYLWDQLAKQVKWLGETLGGLADTIRSCTVGAA